MKQPVQRMKVYRKPIEAATGLKMEGRKAGHWIGVSEIPSAAFIMRCAIASQWPCSR
jgi:hypothetical protein